MTDNPNNPQQRVLSKQEMNEVMRLANIIYFRANVWGRTYWMGRKTAKCPMDMWVYQEMIHELKPDFIVETGTFHGGSALFFAQMLDLVGKGQVITVDIEKQADCPEHPRIDYVTGSAIAAETLKLIKQKIASASSVMVILDSEHKAPFKLEEMQLYGELVTPGNYMIVEDSCFDEFPAWPEFGPGPATALREYMAGNPPFTIDREREKHIITFAPKGFLRKNT